MLSWDLNELFEKCIKAIEINEENIENDVKKYKSKKAVIFSLFFT